MYREDYLAKLSEHFDDAEQEMLTRVVVNCQRGRPVDAKPITAASVSVSLDENFPDWREREMEQIYQGLIYTVFYIIACDLTNEDGSFRAAIQEERMEIWMDTGQAIRDFFVPAL